MMDPNPPTTPDESRPLFSLLSVVFRSNEKVVPIVKASKRLSSKTVSYHEGHEAHEVENFTYFYLPSSKKSDFLRAHQNLKLSIFLHRCLISRHIFC
jgi:hypothetical protein